jgi:uncharacterized RDD family membrane protein YckC
MEHPMTYLDQAPDMLPDPDREPAFYSGVAAKRAFAWILDMVAVTLLTILASLLTFFVGFFFFPILFVAIDLAYRVATIAGGSATPGMRLMGIELRDHRGQRLDGAQAVIHTGGYVASWAFFLPQVASMAAMLVAGRRQGLTDLVMGTAAINRPG